MADTNVEIEGINYYTLYERPDSQEKDAPCILLCHALMSNLHMYDATARSLHRAGYSTLRFDHVGHRNTPPPQAKKATERRMSLGQSVEYHMDDITRHMHQIVKDRTGQSHVRAVIGCSIGGVLALRYAVMFPKDVDKVISIAAPGITAPEDKKPLWTQRIKQFEEDQQTGKDTLCRATVERWLPGSTLADEVVRAEALKHVKTCSMKGYKILADTIRDYDYADEVGKIQKVKCLVIAGSEDGAADPKVLEGIAASIKGAEFVKMQGAGHLPPMHRPDEFNEVMLRFLGSP